MKISKKIIAVVLSVLMILSVMPFAASAADEPYLTFTGTDSFSIKTNNSAKNWNGTLQYSTNASTWTTWNGTQISSDNNVLYLRGTGNTQITGSNSTSKNWVITTQGTVACSGDIRTLLNYAEPESSSMGDYCFSHLFYNCTSLTAAPELPATILKSNCYSNMFRGCTSLTTAPELPATSLAERCYSDMFKGCISLTTVPELPATSLAINCYYEMFSGCTSLTTAPALPATSLATYCYSYMFEGCTSLTTAPVLPATELERYCYQSMFNGCTSLTTAPQLPATALAEYCYFYMFNGCTSLTTAPALPATMLATYCYDSMFRNCTNLTTAPELPATTLASSCYSNMFYGCTSLTTAPELWATTLTNSCYYNMFRDCTSLTTAPELPANDLAGRCYYNMFRDCTSLTTPSELWATDLTEGCYYGMFQGCTGIKLSTEQTAEYSAPYSIPKEETAESVGYDALTNMFTGTGGTFTGTPTINTTYYLAAPVSGVAEVNGVGYETLAEAIAAAQDGDTITILEDVTLDDTIVINDGRKITIDTNGNKIDSAKRLFEIRKGGLTLTGDGSVETTASSAVAVYGSTNSTDADYATFTLGADTTISAPSGYGAMIGANSKAAYGAKLTLNGTINSKYGVYVNGTVQEPADKTNAAQVTINGTVTADNGNAAVYAAGYAKWTVNDGAIIEGGSGIYIKSGDLVVNGGTITATGTKTAYAFNPNGANGTGDAIIIDSCGYPGNVPSVAINGGTVTSANGDAVASYTKQDDPQYADATFEKVTNVIPATSTAVFSSDVSALADDGYRTVYDETKGGYIVDDANNGYFLTIGERIIINFALDVASFKAEGGRIVVNGVNANEESSAKSDKTYSISALETVTGGAYDGNVIVSLEVAPAQLAEVFTISVYGEDGDLKGTVEASVYEYANSMKADATYGELMTALINYGALAKDYFNYDGAEITPAEGYNTDLTADEKNELISRREAGLTTGNASFDGMVYFAKVEPEFKFYFAGTNVGTAQLSDNDLSVVLTKTDNGVAAKVTGFKASDFGKTFSVTVDGTALTINGYAYIASALKSESLKSLATGLFRYAQAAEALA